MQYFITHPEVFLVKGAKRGALYDLSSGHVYSIDENAVMLIESVEQGLSLEEIVTKKNVPKNSDVKKFYLDLKAKGLGVFTNHFIKLRKTHIETYEKKNLNFCWLEITKKCNLKCLHCYMDAKNSGCFKSIMNLDDWEKIICELAEISCKSIQFIGGEPLLVKFLPDLVKFSRSLNLDVEVFTNATLISDFWIELLKDYNVVVKTTIYSRRDNVHDLITRKIGSYKRTIDNIFKMKERGINVQIFTVMMRQNEEYFKETAMFLKELGEEDPLSHCDIVRCSGRGINSQIRPNKLKNWQYRCKADFLTVIDRDFFRRQKQHCCLFAKCCIQVDGNVIPCIMGRDIIYGNVKFKSIKEILQNTNLINLWQTSKDKVKICDSCEYRYACFSCILDMDQIESHNGKKIWQRNNRCLYDPYQGVWLTNNEPITG